MKTKYYQQKRTEIISKMLDNPNETGIYPTSQCFMELDELLFEAFSEGKKEGIEIMKDACIEKAETYIMEDWKPFIDTGSIRRIAEEEILKLKTV